MNVGKLCNFLERNNNAIFISKFQEPDRWLEDESAMLYVNNSNVLMRIEGNGNVKEAIPWETARDSISSSVRKNRLGWTTLAAFDTSSLLRRGINIGAQFPCHEIGGSESPLIGALLGLAIVASIAWLLINSRAPRSQQHRPQ